MDKLNVIKRIINTGIIAVVRAKTPEQAVKIAEAVKVGGELSRGTTKKLRKLQGSLLKR